MNSYSKIRRASSDLPSEPNLSFSPTKPVPENPNLSSSNYGQWNNQDATTLRRSRSASQRFDQEERSQVVGLQSSVKRAFSMRRTSSIDNGYWRIHDGGDGFLAEEEEEGEVDRENRRQGRRKGSSRRGFLGLCKKLVGF